MIKRAIVLLALSVSASLVFSTSAQAAKEREAKTPSSMELLNLGACTPDTPPEKLCQIRESFRSETQRFVDDRGRARLSTTVVIAPYRNKRNGDLQWGAFYKGSSGKWVWLIEPEWSEIKLLNADIAIVRAPGTGQWQRINTLTKARTALGSGTADYLPLLISTWVQGRKQDGFFAQDAGDGTETLRIINTNGSFSDGSVDRVIPAAKLPKGRFPVEALEDGTLLVHRLDANGKVFDQVFEKDLTTALTPPMAPLVIADYGFRRRYAFVELDRARRLFWPVHGSDIRAKPPGMLGIRPVSGRYTAAAEPVSEQQLQTLYGAPANDPSPYAKDLPTCFVDTPECDFSMVWSAIWDQDEEPRIALIGDAEDVDRYLYSYDLPTFDAFAESLKSADYTLVRAISEQSRYNGEDIPSYDNNARTLFVAQRSDGTFDYWSFQKTMNSESRIVFGLYELTDVPLTSEEQAVLYTKTVFRNWANAYNKQMTSESEERIRLAKRAKANREAKEREIQMRREDRFRSALDSRRYSEAIDAAWSVSSQAVHQATIAALKADRGSSVGRAEIRVASAFATAQEKSLLASREYELDRLEIAERRRFATAPATRSGSSPSSSSQAYVDTGMAIMENARMESRMNYLSGKTGSYLCGSASFCN